MNVNNVNNIIIDLGGNPNDINALIERLKNKKETVSLVNVSSKDLLKIPSQADLKSFEKIDVNTRIYIVAHGKPCCPTVTGIEGPDRKQFFCHYSDLSNYLNNRISKQITGNKDIKISLIACYSGVGGDNSFASLFHRDLGQRCQIKANLLARNEFCTLMRNAGKDTGKKFTRSVLSRKWDEMTKSLETDLPKWMEDRHQNPGSKSEFSWNKDGNQVVADAYIKKFAAGTVVLAKNLIVSLPKDHTLSPKYKKSLENIIEQCENPTQLNKKKIDNILSELNEIRSTLNLRNDASIFERSTILAKKSISSSSSIKPKIHKYNLKDRVIFETPKDLNSRLIENQLKPEIIKLFKIGKDTPEKLRLQDSFNDLSNLLANGIDRRVRLGFDIGAEKNIILSFDCMMKMVISNTVSKDMKKVVIENVFKRIETILNDTTVFTPSFHGYIEGVEKSLSYGGLSFYDPIKVLPKKYAAQHKNYIAEMKNSLVTLKNSLKVYLEEIHYAGVKTSEDDIILDERKMKINNVAEIENAIVLTKNKIDELSKLKEISFDTSLECNLRIEQNRLLIRSNEEYLKEMKRTLGLNPKAKSTYEDEVFPAIDKGLSELVAYNSKLEDRLNVIYHHIASSYWNGGMQLNNI